MHKKKLFKLRMSLIAVLALLLAAVFSVSALADEPAGETGDSGAVTQEPGGDKDENGLHAGKHIHVEENGTYTVSLDAFVTGEAHFDTVTVPADIILVLDVSGSMEDDMSEATYEYVARTSQAYSYNSYGNNTTYYYKVGDNYYPVSRNSGYHNWATRYYLRYRTSNYSDWVYLTGTGTSTSRPDNAPTSGGTTIWTGVLYERRPVPAVSKMDALKTAVSTFIDEVALKNKEAEDALREASEDGTVDPAELAKKQSRIAIVKFAGNSRNGTNYSQYANNIGNETYTSGRYTYNYTQVVADLGVVKQGESTTDATTAASWKQKVSALSEGGATQADFGMSYAKAIVTAHANDHNYTDETADDYRSRVVVMFTDGLPTSGNTFEADVANGAVSNSKNLKDQGVTVYSVAVHPDAHPDQDPGTTNFNQYLHAVSSNYPGATSYTNRGDRGEGNYYFAAANASDLDAIFKQIGQSSGSAAVEVSATAVMKDIVSSSFSLPEGATEDDIHIKIVRWNSTTHNWGTGEGYEFTPEQWKTACLTYGAEAAENVSAVIDGDTVDITGFDYSTHYKATSKEQDNDQYDVVNGVNKYTAKLVVSFLIQAKPSAVTGGSVATNGEDSGIYVDGEPLIKFDVPEVEFTPVTYVVDYVTSDTSTDTKASSVKLDYSGVLKNVEMLDDPSDDYLIGELATDFDYTIYTGRYGTISFGDDETDVQRRYVRYAPTTMNWDGYDRIFVKGESKTDSDLDVWAMLCVIPANSVFYEDTYITQTKTVVYNGEEVTIKYTGINYDDGTWSTVGTEGKNQTYHAGDDMGWISGLADDSGYANDMAHTSNTAKAKATFTFSGTGVDIYSRTNGSTGTVTVNVKSAADENESGQKINKNKSIDTKAAAGDFFAIPVCTFTDLPYGKYTATITVTTGGKKEGRMTFYLDGVRVYNPIQPLEGDGNVAQMYGEKNMGAIFTEVRSMFKTDPAAATAEALYLDEYTNSSTVTDLAAIEEAKKALAAAQQARDAYVESTITPAKNAVSEEEYAKSSAESALVSAQNILDSAAAALAEAQATGDAAAIAEAQAAYDDALAKRDQKQTACDQAVAHYNDNIGQLQQNLTDALNGKADYDQDVEDAIAEYDRVNDGVTVGYSTATIEDYDKEGPKSEVYLDQNQSVAISVEQGKTYYIGLSSLKGDEVTVEINAEKTVKLSHSTDLYYECTPEGGTIVIKNTSTNGAILSVTKLRTTGKGNTTSGTKKVSTEETLTYVRSLAKKPVSTQYTGEVLAEDGTVVGDPSIIDDPADEAVLGEDDIVIDNPEPVIENEEETQTEQTTQSNSSTLSKLLSSFFGFFRR